MTIKNKDKNISAENDEIVVTSASLSNDHSQLILHRKNFYTNEDAQSVTISLVDASFIEITSNKGTATQNKMNKIYVEVTNQNHIDFYYVNETNNQTYDWVKIDDNILSDIDWANAEVNWSKIQGKPSFGTSSGQFAEGNHNHSGVYVPISQGVGNKNKKLVTDNNGNITLEDKYSNISQDILGGDTTHSPSSDVIYNALGGKSDTDHNHDSSYVKISQGNNNNKKNKNVVTDNNGNITLEDKASVITVDSEIIDNSSNPVSGNAVHDALAGKSNTDHTHNNYLTSSDISGKVNITDIQDNLTSTDTNKPLSAKQGKELKTLVDNKADITQSITDGDTTHSPSSDAIYDALSNIPSDISELTDSTNIISSKADKTNGASQITDTTTTFSNLGTLSDRKQSTINSAIDTKLGTLASSISSGGNAGSSSNSPTKDQSILTINLDTADLMNLLSEVVGEVTFTRYEQNHTKENFVLDVSDELGQTTPLSFEEILKIIFTSSIDIDVYSFAQYLIILEEDWDNPPYRSYSYYLGCKDDTPINISKTINAEVTPLTFNYSNGTSETINFLTFDG